MSSDGKYTQGICPEGWHIPSNEEWNVLQNFLNPTPLPKLKSNIWDGNNSSGFSAIPSGWMDGAGFGGVGTYAGYWSVEGIHKCFDSGASAIRDYDGGTRFSINVRCIKD